MLFNEMITEDFTPDYGRADNGRSEEQTESLANEMQQDSQANESEGSAEEPAPGADDDGT